MMKPLRVTCCCLLLIPVLVFGFIGPLSAEMKRGGDLIIAVAQTPRHLNGAVQSGVATALPSTQIFAGLVRHDRNWQPQPYLAESWKFSDDGLSFTVKLRKEAKFHDGKPITSEDVAFSVMTVKANHPFKPMMAPVEKVETPDPHTAIFRLSRPHPALLLILSPALCPIIPKHVFGDGQDINNHPLNMKPIGSGPFKFVEYKTNEYVILQRNDNFFIKDRPYLDRIVIKYIMDPSNRLMVIERGEANLYAFAGSTQDMNRLGKVKSLAATKDGYEATAAITEIEFNLRNKPLSDIKVRKAIAHALDRNFIVQKLQGGLSTLCTGPIVPYSPFYSPNVEKYAFDLKKANALLDEAGYVKNKDGQRFSITGDILPTNPEQSKFVMEYAKAQLKKVGVDVQLRSSADFPSWAKRVSNWDFDMTSDIVGNWGDPVIGVERFFICTNIHKGTVWNNMMGYCNEKVDNILATAGKEMDEGKRKALYGEFQKIVVEELPVLPINLVPYHTFYDKKLRNLNDGIWGVMSPLDTVYWEK